MYEEVGGDFECYGARSETLGGRDFGGGNGLTFNTAADGQGRLKAATKYFAKESR